MLTGDVKLLLRHEFGNLYYLQFPKLKVIWGIWSKNLFFFKIP